jgi:diguanylate cyclase (GGDEF)-like protein
MALRRARLLGAGLVLAQSLAPQQGARVTGPGTLTTLAVLLAVGLGAVSLLTWAGERSGVPRRPVEIAALCLDVLLTLAIASMAHASDGALWTLLALPVLEAAFVLHFTGAIATWGLISLLYVGGQVLSFRATGVADVDFLPGVASYMQRTAVVLLLALPAAYLSESLAAHRRAAREATVRAEERSALLARVASAGAEVNRLGAEVVESLAQGALTLGFDAFDVCIREQGSWVVDAEPANRTGPALPPPEAPAGLAVEVARLGGTLLAERETADPEERRMLATAGLAAVVARPLRSGTRGKRIVRVGLRPGRRLTREQVESFTLLTQQAEVALSNDRLVGELHDARADMEYQAYHDALTGLANRARILQHLAGSAGQDGTALLFLDLDGFKQVNDTLGHDVGDELLRAVAGRVSSCVRGIDLVGRLGGDEFTVALANCGEEEAVASAERVIEAISGEFRLDPNIVSISTSVGLALGGPGIDAAELIRRADLAMYRSKEEGPGEWRWFDPEMDAEAQTRSYMEQELRRAVHRQEVEVVYQPIVVTGSSVLQGVEALARWTGPDGIAVDPEDFVSVAEDTGLVVQLGRQILRRACTDFAGWAAVGRAPEWLAVNVSPRELTDPGFLSVLDEVLGETGVAPARLHLEITERMLASPTLRPVLMEAEERGIGIALDDFGRGHSSMVHLRRFRPSLLKIDRAFVHGGATDLHDRAILRAMCALAHDLGMEVLAEGVETQAQRDVLAELSCDLLQGFLFSEPVEAERLPGLVGRPLGEPLALPVPASAVA